MEVTTCPLSWTLHSERQKDRLQVADEHSIFPYSSCCNISIDLFPSSRYSISHLLYELVSFVCRYFQLIGYHYPFIYSRFVILFSVTSLCFSSCIFAIKSDILFEFYEIIQMRSLSPIFILSAVLILRALLRTRNRLSFFYAGTHVTSQLMIDWQCSRDKNWLILWNSCSIIYTCLFSTDRFFQIVKFHANAGNFEFSIDSLVSKISFCFNIRNFSKSFELPNFRFPLPSSR